MGWGSSRLVDNKDVALSRLIRNRIGLENVSLRLRDDKKVVMAAVNVRSKGLQHASPRMKDDKEVVMAAIRNQFTGNSVPFNPFEHASKRLKDDWEFVLAAYAKKKNALEHASKRLRDDKQFILAAIAVSPHANCIKCASNRLKEDWDLILAAITARGSTITVESLELQDNRDFFLMALAKHGYLLESASDRLRDDKDVVLTACLNSNLALEHASDRLKNNKEFLMEAILCKKKPSLIEFASERLRDDKEVVFAAVTQDGRCLRFASTRLRADKGCVQAAVSSSPESLKYALGGLNQDNSCLVASGLWDKNHNQSKRSSSQRLTPKIVLSTRFSLSEESNPSATQFAVLLKEHPYIRKHIGFEVFSPNAFEKSTCDPEWTRLESPCRGTFETCRKDPALKCGKPTKDSCWRYFFRCQLEEAKRSNGMMIQVIDLEEEKHGDAGRRYQHGLGNGQEIENVMAQQVGTKVFRIYQPGFNPTIGTGFDAKLKRNCRFYQSALQFTKSDIDRLVAGIKNWYNGSCVDMTECEIEEIAPVWRQTI